MIDKPTIRADGDSTLLVDLRTLAIGQRLRFWGMLLIGGSVLMTIMVPSWRNFDEPLDAFIPLLTVAAGAVFILLGGRPGVTEVPLARLMPLDGLVRIYSNASPVLEGRDRDIWTDEVREILFGLVRYPRDLARPEVTVEAFTVCLNLYDGSIVPLVEAAPDKLVTFNIARAIGAALDVPVSQTGLGI